MHPAALRPDAQHGMGGGRSVLAILIQMTADKGEAVLIGNTERQKENEKMPVLILCLEQGWNDRCRGMAFLWKEPGNSRQFDSRRQMMNCMQELLTESGISRPIPQPNGQSSTKACAFFLISDCRLNMETWKGKVLTEKAEYEFTSRDEFCRLLQNTSSGGQESA